MLDFCFLKWWLNVSISTIAFITIIAQLFLPSLMPEITEKYQNLIFLVIYHSPLKVTTLFTISK